MRNHRTTDIDAAALAKGVASNLAPEFADVATALSAFRGAAFETLPQPSAELRERLEHGTDVSASTTEETKRSGAGGVRRMVAWVAGLGIVAKILLGTTVAVAAVGGAGAAGLLPGGAQEVFDTVVSTEETTPVEPTDDPSTEPTETAPGEAEPAKDEAEVEGPAEGENFGSYVSEEAQNKEGTGREFGEQISDLAKNNGQGANKTDDEVAPEVTDESTTDSTTGQGSGKPSSGGAGGKNK